MPETNEQIEQEIVDKGLTAPRVTYAEIKAKMDQVVYRCHVIEGTTTTVAVALLPMGEDFFSLAIGESACVDPKNFDKALGEKYAIQRAAADAENKLWELEGYSLKKALTENNSKEA
ncbi:MAG: Gp49 family protein [Bermanella sp.]